MAWCSCDLVGDRAKLRVWNRGLGTVPLVALEVSAIVVELRLAFSKLDVMWLWLLPAMLAMGAS